LHYATAYNCLKILEIYGDSTNEELHIIKNNKGETPDDVAFVKAGLYLPKRRGKKTKVAEEEDDDSDIEEKNEEIDQAEITDEECEERNQNKSSELQKLVEKKEKTRTSSRLQQIASRTS